MEEAQKSFITLKVIWKDEHMFEFSVKASNIDFSGKTEVYETAKHLSDFALKLKDFPNGSNYLLYEIGQRSSYAYFSMRLYIISRNERLGVEVYLESNVPTEYRAEEKSKSTFEIIINPHDLDGFQRELLSIAEKTEGSATLYGISH